MIEARPSNTAYRSALRRAAHQILDDPKILEDPIAIPIIGPRAAENLRTGMPKAIRDDDHGLRATLVVRSRYAEDCLARAFARGAAQYVILGAGLDTFAYRIPYGLSQLRVFEVDHPATQEWKRQSLAAARIPIPSSVTYAPVDFEHQTLAEGLQLAGLDSTKPAFFSWLGVTMYLTEGAISSTLGFIASLPPGGGVALDYALPTESLDEHGKVFRQTMMRRVSGSGEPFVTFFGSAALMAKVQGFGFHHIENLSSTEINARYFSNRSDTFRMRIETSRLLSAEV